MNFLAWVAGLVVLISSQSALAYNDIGKIWRNNQAVDMQGQQKKTESFDEFARLLAEDPFNGIYQYNMGTAFIAIEDVAKAKTMMSKLAGEKNLPANLAFAVNYNMGVLHTLESDIDAALDSYQVALKYMPDSVETKTNIELLIQQQKQGGGKGKGKPQKDKNQQGQQDEDQEQQDDQQDQDEQQKEPQQFQNQPQQFKSKEMSNEDVRRILEELKNQEQQIRAKHDRKGGKEKDRDKNW